MPEVRCVDCGYLTMRRTSTRELGEVEAEIRDSGSVPTDEHAPVPNVPMYAPWLICFRQKFFLQEEQREGNQAMGLAQRTFNVMTKSRICDQFTPWLQGFTPKEHLEMVQDFELRKWQADREEADRADRAKREQEARDFQTDQAAQSRRHNNWSLGAAIAAVIAAVVVPLVTEAFRKEAARPIVNVYNNSDGAQPEGASEASISAGPDLTTE